MHGDTGIGLLCLLSGSFCLLVALLNVRYFFEGRNERLFTAILGSTVARIFYALFGACVIVLGILNMTGKL